MPKTRTSRSNALPSGGGGGGAASGYIVVHPNELFGGKSYSDYLAEFWNWLYSTNCDQNNTGDVVFLRGMSFGTSPDQGYVGGPVVNVGTNALNISKRQGVFFCNISTNTEAINEREEYSEAQLRSHCIVDLNQSTIPVVEQILIDGNPITLPQYVTDCSQFRFITREFILKVPDSTYGRTIAPFMDVQLSPADYRCVASGYCFLIIFEPGPHVIYSVGKGKQWVYGEYISELLYEINVRDTEIDRNSTLLGNRDRPKLPLSDKIYLEIQQLVDKKEIDPPKAKELWKMIGSRNQVSL